MMDSIDVLNIVGRGEVAQNKLLEKLMYLMWYEHMKRHMKREYDMGPKDIYGHPNHELLAEKYYNEFGKTVATWDISNRNIGDFL
jgi:hypothetical protein